MKFPLVPSEVILDTYSVSVCKVFDMKKENIGDQQCIFEEKAVTYFVSHNVDKLVSRILPERDFIQNALFFNR